MTPVIDVLTDQLVDHVLRLENSVLRCVFGVQLRRPDYPTVAGYP